MPLSLDAITQISRAVAREHRRDLEIMGVTSTEGGSDRVELLIAIKGCHEGPCRLSLNLNRSDGQDFETELKGKLDEALRGHFSADPV